MFFKVFKKKVWQKFLALFLSFLLLVNPITIPLALAQEVDQEASATVEETSQNEESSTSSSPDLETNDQKTNQTDSQEDQQSLADQQPDSTPTPTLIPEAVTPTPTIIPKTNSDGNATIQTGEANSQAVVTTKANINEAIISGEMTTSQDPCAPPVGETTCPQPVIINQENSAVATDSAISLANTGENTIDGVSGDALINTGNATAGAEIGNEINTNLVIFDDEGDGEQLTDQSTEDNDEENPSQIIIVNQNSGDLANQADVSANTGENSISESLASATIQTGDALALANVLNLLNTNIVGSDFQFYFLNLSDINGDINFNEVWKKIVENNSLTGLNLVGGENSNLFLLENINLAELTNEIQVVATSGGNNASENQGDVLIATGDATALANVLNFVNLNFIGSQFLFGGINILGSFVGNIILPRPDRFAADMLDETEGANIFFEATNNALVENIVSASANSGVNTADNSGGDNTIETGEAISRVNSLSFVNLNILNSDWFFFMINNLGSCLGKIFNWSMPGSQENLEENGSIFLQLGLDNQSQSNEQNPSLDNQADDHFSPLNSVAITNQAQIGNNIQVAASTGDNQAINNQGNTKIVTGTAKALANLLNFVNLNIWGSRWFGGLLNILGSWTGHIIFAYPDIAVSFINNSESVFSDETFSYTVNFRNQGYDEANDVQITVEVPQGVIFVGDSSGISAEISGRFYTWNIGRLRVGEQGSFVVIVKMDPDYYPQQHLSFWEKLIPSVWAAENTIESRVSLVALAKTSDPETDLSNNSASAVTIVHYPVNNTQQNNNLVQVASDQEEVDQRQPLLEITASNNVGKLVYPGDTVTFEIMIKNTGEGTAYNTYLSHRLFDHNPQDFGTAILNIGIVEPGKTIKLSFGMALQDGGLLPAGLYFTESQAIGFAVNGNEVFSDKAITSFEIRLKNKLISEVKAAEPSSQLLGLKQDACEQKEEVLPYALLLLLSVLWISERKIKIVFQEVKKLRGIKKVSYLSLEITTFLIGLISFGYSLYKIISFLGLLKTGVFEVLSRVLR